MGTSEQYYTEQLVRLPETFLCYLPDKGSPEVKDLPLQKSGSITFGSFNNFAKVTVDVLRSWIKILKAVPGSRLLLKAKSLSDKSTCRYLYELFQQETIEKERLILLSMTPSTREHLDTYNRIDIALDTFPYNGTTTTCEAMWMGVPVITLAGQTHASRVGVSLLSNVGLPDLIVNTKDEYVDLAIMLANDLNRLKSYQKSLRETMAQSPLCDTEDFTLNLEIRFRKMWETWCQA